MNNHDRSYNWIYLLIMAILVATFALSAWAWTQLPTGSEIPVHWDINGNPDRYGSKFEGLFILPLIVVATSALLLVLPKISPRKANLVESKKAILYVHLATVIFMSGLHTVTVLNLLGTNIRMKVALALGIGLLFVMIGNFMGKIQSNFFVGVRTPWTLSSDKSWNKTHRLAGKLFVGAGFLYIISAFIPGTFFVYILISSVFAIIGITFPYSYIVWKQDQK